MGLFERLFGSDEQSAGSGISSRRSTPSADERAIERYRYLVRTAPPETIEQVHVEAFGKLTDEQRAVIYEELSRGAGTGERPLSSEPATLARAATRAEMRSPGSLERTLTAPRSGSSFAANVTSALLGTVAGYVIGSALVSAFLPWDAAYDSEASSGLDAAETDTDTDTGTDFGDFGGFDF
ncbi:hypothetical protein [uncultured Schumannella sp.]|uniref:hypothetical protein n=1 Tax=uncultured Schumannella sp. TaxID=1195956 RepID=UPI0025D8DDA1|nr:hypothetical protein [uncultured Schumannella sp.]